MRMQIDRSEFRMMFKAYDRMDNFSYAGLNALYDYLEDCMPDYELDVIGLCCDYAEDEIANVLREYNLESIEELEEATVVVWKDEVNVLYAGF